MSFCERVRKSFFLFKKQEMQQIFEYSNRSFYPQIFRIAAFPIKIEIKHTLMIMKL